MNTGCIMRRASSASPCTGSRAPLAVAARIIESVPDLDSRFYASTQVMDEARHVELFSRFIRDKIGMFYPVNNDLARLLSSTLTDSRWDLPYLGMQVLAGSPAAGSTARRPAALSLTGSWCSRRWLGASMAARARHAASTFGATSANSPAGSPI